MTAELIIGGTSDGKIVAARAAMANRHGLITGATGTGKTVSLQILAEGFSRLGIPVFAADIKGDLSGLGATGELTSKISERVKALNLTDFHPEATPVVFWDLWGRAGHPLRTTVLEVGPVLMARMLALNETQESLLHICYAAAEDRSLLLLNLEDLRSTLTWLVQYRQELEPHYGHISPQSVAAIQRKVFTLLERGGDVFFGEPAWELAELLQKNHETLGTIHILDSTELIANPYLYSTFLLWLLAELFEELDEVGDQPLPRLVFFFDEAHLLFDNISAELLTEIERVVRLIRSKGVGVYFVTQHPLDIPDTVLGQLGLRIQHALRAFTPRDQKAVKTAAQTFRQNPTLVTDEVITELKVGEALVSVLDEKGSPTVVERTLIVPPRSRIGPLAPVERQAILKTSKFAGKYDTLLDRESAHERLEERARQRSTQQESSPRSPRSDTKIQAFLKSFFRSLGSYLGRLLAEVIRGQVRGKR